MARGLIGGAVGSWGAAEEDDDAAASLVVGVGVGVAGSVNTAGEGRAGGGKRASSGKGTPGKMVLNASRPKFLAKFTCACRITSSFLSLAA